MRRLLPTPFPDGDALDAWSAVFSRALERAEHSFAHRRKYYLEDGANVFDHLNADHMASFLYFLGTLWQEQGMSRSPPSSHTLNKVMHGLDLFYLVKMPDIFLLECTRRDCAGECKYGDYPLSIRTVPSALSAPTIRRLGTARSFTPASVIGKMPDRERRGVCRNPMVIGMAIPE